MARGGWSAEIHAGAGFMVPCLVIAGIVTVITNSTTVLAVFMARLVMLWAGSTIHHLIAPEPRAVARAGASHA